MANDHIILDPFAIRWLRSLMLISKLFLSHFLTSVVVMGILGILVTSCSSCKYIFISVYLMLFGLDWHWFNHKHVKKKMYHEGNNGCIQNGLWYICSDTRWWTLLNTEKGLFYFESKAEVQKLGKLMKECKFVVVYFTLMLLGWALVFFIACNC